MKISEVRKQAFNKYKSHYINSWIISIICGLFIAAILLLGVLSEVLLIAAIPLLVLPFLFACMVSHLGLNAVDELSGRNLFRFFGLFFRAPFLSSFSGLKSFLKALLVEIAGGILITTICYAIFSSSPTFNATINDLMEYIRTNTLTEEILDKAMSANDNELYRFVYISNAITVLSAAMMFIVSICYESITIYIRLNLKEVPLANQIARAAIKTNSKNYFKAFFALNWPLFVLMIIGMVIGVFVAIKGFNNYSIAGVVGLSIGVATSTLYLPFYFSNMETIFDNLAIDIAALSEEYVKNVFRKYGLDVEMKVDEHEVVNSQKKEEDKEENSEDKK